MKTKISIEIHKDGNALYEIIKMVAGNNAGIANVKDNDIIGVLVAKKIDYPASNKNSFYTKETGASANELHISDDGGKTYYCSLTWKEVSELNTISEMDLSTENFKK